MGIKAFNHGDDFVNKFVRAVVSDSTGLDATTEYVAPSEPIQASGGVISDYTDPGPGNIYRAHIFTSSGTFEITTLGTFGATVDYLVVGGGGAGGTASGNPGKGGGGAGGLRTATGLPVSASSYPVTVGAGGATTPLGTNSTSRSGNPSVFSTITSQGGGGGGNGYGPYYPDAAKSNGAPGGSGGGGGGDSSVEVVGGTGNRVVNTTNPAPSQGNDGGDGTDGSGADSGGGGGGAGGPGNNAYGGGWPPSASTIGGNGGNGSASVYAEGPGNPITYAGGGGGGGSSTGGTGGPGGGGNGAAPPGGSTAGTAGLGGGGGGGAGNVHGRGGGSGVVVVRYQIGSVNTGSAKATGGAISFYNNKTIHTFTNSGTFENTSGSPLSIEYIAIAGGGAGGCSGSGDTVTGGGGGAGGVVTSHPGVMPDTNPEPAVGPGSPNALTITIGSGGGRVISADLAGDNGNNTTISGPGPWSVTAYGGGGGGGNSTAAPGASTLGSAGGGAESNGSDTPFTPAQGHAGSSGSEAGNYGGNGGGAGSAAGDVPSGAGNGVRLPSTYRNPVVAPGPGTGPQVGGGLGSPGPAGGFYIGGGGSSTVGPFSTLDESIAAGYGGGGQGKYNSKGQDGVVNTGGGGGAGHGGNGGSGSGGSGIVLISYPT